MPINPTYILPPLRNFLPVVIARFNRRRGSFVYLPVTGGTSRARIAAAFSRAHVESCMLKSRALSWSPAVESRGSNYTHAGCETLARTLGRYPYPYPILSFPLQEDNARIKYVTLTIAWPLSHRGYLWTDSPAAYVIRTCKCTGVHFPRSCERVEYNTHAHEGKAKVGEVSTGNGCTVDAVRSWNTNSRSRIACNVVIRDVITSIAFPASTDKFLRAAGRRRGSTLEASVARATYACVRARFNRAHDPYEAAPCMCGEGRYTSPIAGSSARRSLLHNSLCLHTRRPRARSLVSILPTCVSLPRSIDVPF